MDEISVLGWLFDARAIKIVLSYKLNWEWCILALLNNIEGYAGAIERK